MSDNEYEDEVAIQSEGDDGREELDKQRLNRSPDRGRQGQRHPAVGEFSRGQSSTEHQTRQRPLADDTVLAEIKKINITMRTLVDRVDGLESERRDSHLAPPTPKRRATSETHSWASRMDEDASELGALSDDEDGGRDLEHPHKTIALSESNASLVTSSFGSTISNGERRRVRSAFPTPEVKATRCPKLDPVFKTKSKAETKTADAELARIQAFVHDPVGPLVQLLHGLDTEEEAEPRISADDARVAVKDAIRLLGNASAQISKLRRKKVLKKMNPDIQDLADEDIFQEAAPDLFGSEFEKRMRKRAKSLQVLDDVKPSPQPTTSKFFRGGRPTVPQRGGGPFNRGETIGLVKEGQEPEEVTPRVVCTPLTVTVKNYQSVIQNVLCQRGVIQRVFSEVKHPLESIAGRLTLFSNNWERVTQDQWVLATIQGYRLELLREPVQLRYPRETISSSEEQSLIHEEIKKLLQKGAITKLLPSEAQQGFYSNLFLVPKKDGGMRPVINLKRLNEYVVPHHFKMEGIHTLKDLLRRNDWMTKVDLKDAYFTIPIHTHDRPLLRFSALDSQYQFTCLPFGLSSAPWVFTKTLKPVATLLRELGVRLVIYIDDILVVAESQEEARDHTLGLIYLLECLGFVVHPEKTVTTPTQEIEFLGMVVDSRSMELRVPGNKLKKIRQEAASVASQTPQPTAREVSRLLGKLNAVSQAIPPGPLFCRAMQRDLAASLGAGDQHYDAPCPLSPSAREELTWWSDQLTGWNGKSLVLRKPDLQIESDASRIGWGASCNGVQTGGPWSQKETRYHINCLELLAATLAARTFLKGQENKRILLLIDNQTAVAYINNLGGTVSAQATLLARNLWLWGLEKNILLTAQYLPGSGECQSRHRVTSDEGPLRLDAEPVDIPAHPGAFPRSGGGSLRVPTILPTAEVLQLEARSIRGSNRRLSSRLEGGERLREPSVEPRRTSPIEGGGSSSRSSADSSSLAIATMVPQTSQPPSLLPFENQPSGEGNGRSVGRESARDNPTTSRVAYLRQHYSDKRISGEATELLLSSWRQKSAQSYDSLCKRWISWCTERSLDPVSGPIDLIQ